MAMKHVQKTAIFNVEDEYSFFVKFIIDSFLQKHYICLYLNKFKVIQANNIVGLHLHIIEII